MESPIHTTSILDAHLHQWDLAAVPRSWVAESRELPGSFLPSDAYLPGVDAALIVEANADDGWAEALWMHHHLGPHPMVAGIVAFAPVEDIRLPAYLDHLADLDTVVGVRRLLQDEPTGFITSAPVLGGLAELSKRGIAFDACIRAWQLGELCKAVEQVEGLRVVLDHLGKPLLPQGLESPSGQSWLAGMERLSRAGAYVKLSGMVPEADDTTDLRTQVVPFLSATYELFGADRLMG